MAVNKVEELTRQLDELRNGKRKPLGNSNIANKPQDNSDVLALSELEKLKSELAVSIVQLSSCKFTLETSYRSLMIPMMHTA